MIPGVIRRFTDSTERAAYSVSANEVGGLFYQLSDGTFHLAIAEGAASTKWQKLTGGNMRTMVIGTVSTKGSDAAVIRMPSPCAGKIVLIQSAANAALATGDATLTAKIGTNAVTDGVITITQSGSAAGDVDSAVPSAANTVAVGDMISITGGGSSSATATATVTVTIAEGQ
jgi:hypothetical protein